MEFQWTWCVLNPKGKSLENTWAVVVVFLGFGIVAVLSLPGMLLLLGFEGWVFSALTMCVDSLEVNPTGGGEKAPLPKTPARFGGKHWISGLLYWCAWTASLPLGLMAIWIRACIQYLGLKISSHKYRHCWEMSYQGMSTGNASSNAAFSPPY